MEIKSKWQFQVIRDTKYIAKLEAIESNLVDFMILSTDYTCPIQVTKVWVIRVYLMKYSI